jgi:hypothetical protein
VQLLGHLLYSRISAAATYIKTKSLGVKRVIRQPLQFLLLHFLAPAAKYPSDFHLQENAYIPAGEVSNPSGLFVVVGTMNKPAQATRRFFSVRTSRITRALGSPKIPKTVCSGRKPGNRYVSHSLRFFAIRKQYHFSEPVPNYEYTIPKGLLAYYLINFTHSLGRRPKIFKQFPQLRQKPYWGNQLWSKGYCVDTVGLDEEMIRKYVKYQEEKDRYIDQLKFGFK